jgi:hypothetical protein
VGLASLGTESALSGVELVLLGIDFVKGIEFASVLRFCIEFVLVFGIEFVLVKEFVLIVVFGKFVFGDEFGEGDWLVNNLQISTSRRKEKARKRERKT